MPTKFAMRLLAGTAVSALLTGASFAADAEARPFDIPQQDAATALQAFAMQSGRQVLFPYEAAKGKQAPEVKGDYSDEEVIALLAASAGLKVTADDGRTVTLRPQFAQAAEAGGGSEVEALIVTAQKREEDIQDVPIAISAFTQETLDRSQVAGGPDLMTQVPNMTFTKTNFTSYSIQLRGIGTQAISATVDNAVAVAFNNTPFIRNRFFEQEFYDLQRVEVLRGPQGTLYGRNATAGVVNLISNKPKLDIYEANLSGDLSNYNSSRLAGMVNIPLANEVAALRIAGAWTKREGYAFNELSGNPIDGRDLWSTRVSLRFAPTDRFDANLIWEHFEEDDDRIRSGKQLCKTDHVTELTAVYPDGTTVVLPVNENTRMYDYGNFNPGTGNGAWSGPSGTFSQGCEPSSLYAPDSFETPLGASAPYYGPLSSLNLPTRLSDPYASRTQSRDLRVIESMIDPEYRAKTDVVELQVSYDLTDALTLTSETGYSSDFIFSQQDYNRFNSAPNVWATTDDNGNPSSWVQQNIISPDGVFCDPQIGCSDRLVAMDLATATSRHFSQELRIGSSYDGPFNFSLGANFLRYDTEDKYYVFINSLSIYTASQNGTIDNYIPGVSDNYECLWTGFDPPDPNGSGGVSATGCVYMDPNPISNLNDLGRNYFLSRNPYKLISYAVFGEAYYQIADALKLTAGLRWTVDKKEAPRIPSWLLANTTVGLPVAEVVEQEWREPTGRLAIDWKPELGFTDETLLYASYAHGYKAGGMNPPAAGLVCYGGCGDYVPQYMARSAAKPKSFEAEFVDAFELGAKNTFLDGSLTLNLAAFYYDYEGYQLSQIVDRSAITQNFDATVWGLEIEADWRPLENLRLGFKGGYENTKVADGMRAIDVMDRTAGTPGWVVVSPFPTFPSNCVLPAWLYFVNVNDGLGGLGGPSGGHAGGCELAYLFRVDPVTGLPYVPNPTQTNYTGVFDSLAIRPGYPGWDPTGDYGNNLGEGFFKDLSGNELPNAPDFTATITADYTIPLPNDWLATVHTDLYYQSEAWTRIFNTEGYDKLKAYTNVNLAAIFTQEELGWKVMAYVKNVFDRDSITGSFLNSDDTGLTTNVFLTEPRLYGLRVTKEWNGGPWWTGANLDHTGPYPLTVELGGQVQRHDAPYNALDSQAFAMVVDQINVLDDVQSRDLDWGDGRSVRLEYRPTGTAWNISAGVRYGRANTELNRDRAEYEEPVVKACAFNDPFWRMNFCNPASPLYLPLAYNFQGPAFADTSAKDREEHTIVDFEVGYDVGLGLLTNSELRAGIRYAEFESTTTATGEGQAGWDINDGWYFTGSYVQRYETELTAQRGFNGSGPTLTWETALPLFGNDQTGRLNVDWSVTGGVLFGEQEASFDGYDHVRYLNGPIAFGGGGLALPLATDSVTTFDLPGTRSTDVTAPLVDLSLGLSYEVGRINVGAGYRWERYFDILDVGYGERQDGDRTIDGPYFKLAVGFGG